MSKFVLRSETPTEELEWGKLTWLSRPPATDSKQLTSIDVELAPGNGHAFHKHPDQEEMIVCVSGTVEQWIGEEKRILGPGDAVFLYPDVVHATYNDSDEPARLLVTLGPCVGEEGYELVDVADQEPWKSLRPSE
ncbi:cupin domain-containing protein [Akkermansiaceae bacterium]|nr:cupin domain-containing protein [Akkermansiaceae bacterium]